MQTCIMSSLPRCIFRCSVFRYVTLVSFFFKLCYLIVTLLLWWRINTYLLTNALILLKSCTVSCHLLIRCWIEKVGPLFPVFDIRDFLPKLDKQVPTLRPLGTIFFFFEGKLAESGCQRQKEVSFCEENSA